MVSTCRLAYEWEDSKWIDVSVCFTRRWRGMGERVRQMQISQPPIYTMEYSLACCPSEEEDFLSDYEGDGERPRDGRTVTNDEGLKLGDLCEAAHKMKVEHMFCVNAPVRFHDSERLVRLSVTFEGSVRLRRDDPKRTSREEKAEAHKEFKALSTHRGDYVRAKIDGRFMKISKLPTIEHMLTSVVVLQHGIATRWSLR